ncbi:neurogenic locus notch -like protein [Brachionus plicatilis]|uniref:Neurogenic locus notch-like protein n=1 Tax=Brachionus plicatilis TaxID=10195 RepID=A0A3M7SW08_BRAPC|nr:neurogenic locus notch -like protein [Brachionus plicatilis]
MAYSVGRTLFILDLKTKLTSEQHFDHDHDIFLIKSLNETHFYTVDQNLVISFYSLNQFISETRYFASPFSMLELAYMSPDCCILATFASSIEIHDVNNWNQKTQMDFEPISIAYMAHNNNFLLSDRLGHFIEISDYKDKVREYNLTRPIIGIEYVDKSLVISFIDICVVLWNILPEKWLYSIICGFKSISSIKHQKYKESILIKNCWQIGNRNGIGPLVVVCRSLSILINQNFVRLFNFLNWKKKFKEFQIQREKNGSGNENFYDEEEILIKVNGKSIPKFDSLDDLESDQAANLLTSKMDIGDCLSNCSNNGKCILENNKFQCECDSFYIGPSCETDVRPCSSNPCLNNSTCKNQMSERKYLCECQKNTQSNSYLYYGFSCENKVDVCKNETCSSKGNCVDIDNKPKCECFYLYSGDYCEIESQTQKTIKKAIKTSSIIAIIFIATIFLFFIILDFSNLFIWKKV